MTETEKKISVPVSLALAGKLEARAAENGRAVGREVQKILEAAFHATRVASGATASRRRKPSTRRAA